MLAKCIPARPVLFTRGFTRCFSNATFNNTQIRLKSRPVGLPTKDNWSTVKEEISSIADNDIVVKVQTLSLDPAMRGWMNDAKSYIAPVGIDEVMRAGGVGTVVASKNPKFVEGDVVTGMLGVQEFAHLTEQHLKPSGIVKIQLNELATDTVWLNTLGMPGMTAYFGFHEVGLPRPGETIVVSAAAGAVGQSVGQLAKIMGLRVVGIAGGQEKCDWVVGTLGFDACIDYKASASSVHKGLKEHCPKGVDIFFDNVGGDILDSVLARINQKARIVVCGAISQYNSTEGVVGPKNYLSLLVNRARMEGMVVFDYAKQYHVAVKALSELLASKKMVSREHVVEGLENFPDALNVLFSGKNFGKLVLRVSK
mgnify:CR=1 FL=1